MELLYRGFDGLDVSFAAQIREEMSRALETAKEEAQRFRRPTPLSWRGVQMLVSESGARGGYAFLASTGDFGATWFFKKPNSRDPWGIRVSCNSFNLAVNGLGFALSELYRTLDQLGVTVPSGAESIGRVDYALDFLAPDFELVPELFVMHSNANRADHIEEPEISCNGRSGRITSVTIGKMPGRQVIVYDKRAEVIAKHKVGWWEIWNSARLQAGRPTLNSEFPAESRLWRVELRAGKKHLKDRWAIRTWADLSCRFGDMVADMLSAIRYTNRIADSNRSRWPNSALWDAVLHEAGTDLFEMTTGVNPDLVKRVQMESHDQLLASQMTGLLTTRAALCGIQARDLPSYAKVVGQEMAREISMAPKRFEQKLTRAAGRYSLGPSTG